MWPTRRRSSSPCQLLPEQIHRHASLVIGIIGAATLWTQPADCGLIAAILTEERSWRKATKRAVSGFGATMAEVAALAGVTKMTVSRVLRHPEKVTPATRARVSEAIATMGYVPNRLAGSLTAGATGLVAAIVPTLRHSLFADTLEGLSDVLVRGRARPDRLVEPLPHRRRGKPDPLDPGAPARRDRADRPHPHQRRARSSPERFGIPVVETWETGDEPVDMVVGYSNREAAHAMTARADRAPATAGSSSSTGRARTTSAPAIAPRAICAAMQEAGLQPPPIHVVHDEARSCRRPAPRHCVRQIAEQPDVDAVFFTSDVFAVGAILACRELGIAVPGRDRHRGLPRPRDRPGGVPDPDHRACAGAWRWAARPGEMILARLAGSGRPEPREDCDFSIIVARKHAAPAVKPLDTPRLDTRQSYR